MKKFPIVYIHFGKSDYLYYTLHQARVSNPNSDIILISDNKTSYFSFVKHYPISEYYTDAASFEKVYRHYSNNSFQYERFCIVRWFVLCEFVRKSCFRSIVYSDSDVLLYRNLYFDMFSRFNDFDLTYCSGNSAGFTFIRNCKILDDLCVFFLECYQNSELRERLELKWKKHLNEKIHGGVCDMTLLGMYRSKTSFRIGESFSIIDNVFYDPNFHDRTIGREGEEWEMTEDGLKKVYWFEDSPYCKLLPSGNKVEMAILHFQGRSKRFMRNYIKSWSFSLCLKISATKLYCVLRMIWLRVRIFKERFSRFLAFGSDMKGES